MGRMKSGSRIALLGVLLLSLACAPAAAGTEVLAFEYENTGALLACYPVKEGTAFAIVYTHSIHLTPVEESYVIRRGMIMQERVAYEEYGIGMPANAEGGERFAVVDGRYVVSGMNRAFRQVDMRVARVTASQELSIDGKRIAFTAWAKPGAWIRMKVRTVPAWRVTEGGEPAWHAIGLRSSASMTLWRSMTLRPAIGD